MKLLDWIDRRVDGLDRLLLRLDHLLFGDPEAAYPRGIEGFRDHEGDYWKIHRGDRTFLQYIGDGRYPGSARWERWEAEEMYGPLEPVKKLPVGSPPPPR